MSRLLRRRITGFLRLMETELSRSAAFLSGGRHGRRNCSVEAAGDEEDFRLSRCSTVSLRLNRRFCRGEWLQRCTSQCTFARYVEKVFDHGSSLKSPENRGSSGGGNRSRTDSKRQTRCCHYFASPNGAVTERAASICRCLQSVPFVILRYLLDTSIVSSPISRKPTRRS